MNFFELILKCLIIFCTLYFIRPKIYYLIKHVSSIVRYVNIYHKCRWRVWLWIILKKKKKSWTLMSNYAFSIFTFSLRDKPHKVLKKDCPTFHFTKKEASSTYVFFFWNYKIR